MNLLSILLTGIGLSVDSFAASATTGACMAKLRIINILKIASFMAVFQAILPLVGWFAGYSLKSYIEYYDHWIAFFLLILIGAKMIYEGIKESQSNKKCFCPSNNLMLAGMALATSIDALVIGIGYGMVDVNIWITILIIGITTFVFSFSGVLIGHSIGTKLNFGFEIFGGIILIGLGVKILIEHLS